MEDEKKDSALVRSSAAEYLTFVASTGEDKDSIEMRYEDENIWLTQKMMATLYDVGLPTINEHIKKIYADHEQDEAATIRKFRIVQNEGGRQVTRSVNQTQPSGCALPPFTAMEPTKRKRMAFWTRKIRKILPTSTRAVEIFWMPPFRITTRCSTRTTRRMVNGSRITTKMYRSA